ncbi:MAG: aminotransferase class I/II-fold pyridoxal phosphate-dependent enzyme, partial [Clostridiales Family XIII bacterium]|nr:aminotransferase class I/II-fold pyridoxal phosphate-dependent enzyme [Clostridiales Family XIII bacterium]
MKIETKCVHSGYKAENGGPDALPIYQSTTFKYDSTEHIGALFDLKESGYFYTRLANPTVGFAEEKIADLEGGVGAMMTSSGQAANLAAIANIASAGDHVICASQVYGGTFNLFHVTLRKLGIDFTFIDQEMSEAEIQNAFRPETKAIFGETIANPAISVLDMEKFARLARKNGVPLIVDNTFATPILCRPIEYGAD